MIQFSKMFIKKKKKLKTINEKCIIENYKF